MFATLWQYQNTMQGQRRNMGIWSGAQQYAETLLKKDKNLENDWLIGDESWRDGKIRIRSVLPTMPMLMPKKKAERVNISTPFILMK